MHVEERAYLRYKTKLSRNDDSNEVFSIDLSASVNKATKKQNAIVNSQAINSLKPMDNF